ncbi:hypothetical protein MHB71_25650 [Paenibacillus sp. FSL H7-0940]|uniref:hypothetical protein n=1 Tax=Paenibacillus sp. FSL H7-0940 TaxID=2921443 RepID=UPI0030EBFAC8
MRVELTADQQQLRNTIEKNLLITKKWNEMDREIIDEAFLEMKVAAHQLHQQLTPKPKHHRYMIENRGLQPEDPEFYNHIHPVEDLLKYLDNISANDDPIDHTLGQTFDFNIYTSRWGHYDRYQITRNAEGWFLKALSYQGQCAMNGEGELIRALEHDGVAYPRNFGSFLYSIWYRAQDEGLTYDEVKLMLDELSEWISQTEKTAPRHFQI